MIPAVGLLPGILVLDPAQEDGAVAVAVAGGGCRGPQVLADSEAGVEWHVEGGGGRGVGGAAPVVEDAAVEDELRGELICGVPRGKQGGGDDASEVGGGRAEASIGEGDAA